MRTATPPEIDGVLDDPAWEAAIPIGELVQVEPRQGVAPTEASDIRILFDTDYLYLGMRFFDREPEKIISTTMERDAFLSADDRVEIVFDTFHDRRNAFFFQMNPAGSMGDALITNNGEDFNKPWDGIWEGRSSVDELGWSTELAIPFKTLNFKEGLSTWGLNLARYIGRRNEEARWSGANQDYRLFQVVHAGELRGLSGMDQGIGLDVSPFYVGTWDYDREDDDKHLIGDAGADALYKLTPSLNLTLTANTDFAETEADDQRVNLTRFPLFFPERRDFFIQDEGLFQFSSGGVIPFFSRTIGLSDGKEVPIAGGAKLTGRAGDYSIGVLDVFTEEDGELDAENLFVGRVTKNVGAQSTVGAIVTHGDPSSEGQNTLFGVDARFRSSTFLGDKNLQGTLWGLRTDDDPDSGTGTEETTDYAFGGSVSYPNNLWSWYTSFAQIGADFDPALGFVARRDLKRYSSGVTYQPRVNDVIRLLEIGIDADVITDTGNDFQTLELEVQPIGIEWNSGGSLRFEVEHTREDLTAPFDISDVVIEAEDYDFTAYRLEGETPEIWPFGVEAVAQTGGFFGGDRDRYSLELRWRAGPQFTTSAEYERNELAFDTDDLTTQVARIRFNVSFTPDVSWNSFLQWDSESDRYGIQSRMRWIMSPGREMFVVFNEALVEEDDSISPSFQELAFKVVYTVRF